MPTICLIPGDGIGQEVVPAAAQVLSAVAPDLQFVAAEAGWSCFQRRGTALPDETLAAVASADATLFGATQSPSGTVAGYRSPILALRQHFDLYANLRPIAGPVQLAGVLSHGEPLTIDSHGGKSQGPGSFVDLLIVRENTEGLYSGRERRAGDTAIAERVITRGASQRIARTAFDLARQRARLRSASADASAPAPRTDTSVHQSLGPQMTIVHKANVLKVSDGLFREACLDVARDYPDVTVRELLVDAAAMWLVKDPARFDVIVTTNLFGDILSDLAAGLIGGLGVAPSVNMGAGQVAVFEPVHGSAPDIAGQGLANPTAAILSAAMLLDHIGLPEAARQVRQAVSATLQAGLVTPDLGGTATTTQVVHAITQRLYHLGEP